MPFLVDPPHDNSAPFFKLESDNWDDYTFKTTFGLSYIDARKVQHEVGVVKIAPLDATGPYRTLLRPQFDSVPKGFVSFGQSPSYYQNLARYLDKQDDVVDLLASLGDLHLYPSWPDVEAWPVVATSFWRELNAASRDNIGLAFAEVIRPRVGVILDWFRERLEDPVHRLPYDTREGGYQWSGTPRDARDEIEAEFGSATSPIVVNAAVDELEEEATEWLAKSDLDPTGQAVTDETDPVESIARMVSLRRDLNPPTEDVGELRKRVEVLLGEAERLYHDGAWDSAPADLDLCRV